jgi:hypothetical protein
MENHDYGMIYAREALKEMGAASAEWSDDGRCLVLLEDGTHLAFQVASSPPALMLRSQLRGGGVEGLSGGMLRRLLQANFLWQGTQGSEMVVENGRAVLVRSLDPSRMSYQRFRQILEQFLNTSASWSEACCEPAATMPAV